MLTTEKRPFLRNLDPNHRSICSLNVLHEFSDFIFSRRLFHSFGRRPVKLLVFTLLSHMGRCNKTLIGKPLSHVYSILIQLLLEKQGCFSQFFSQLYNKLCSNFKILAPKKQWKMKNLRTVRPYIECIQSCFNNF